MVRKTFSYVFLCLILLNATAYYGLFMGWKYKHEIGMLAWLDAERYRENEVHTIKIPIAVPYAFNMREFVRVNGTFEHSGTFYRLVKQKLANDTLILVCIRDEVNRKMHEVFEEVAYSFTDQQHSSRQTTKPMSLLMKEYVVTTTVLHRYISGWVINLQQQTRGKILVSSFISSIRRPPQMLML